MRRLRVIALCGATTIALSGCGFHGLYNVPLPGGADIGDHPLHLTAEFANALDLVPQSAVRLDDVPVGRVSAISLGKNGQVANVSLLVNDDVDLPANATASIQQTSLLGEKYVELDRPTSGASSTPLRDGDTIPIERTSQGIEFEQVLGALSMLLNGGGLNQIRTITRELNTTLDGKGAVKARELLTNIDQVVGQLNERRADIVTAIDELNTLSKTLDENRDKINTTLDGISPGLQVLADQKDQFVAMLKSLDRLSDVTVSTIDKTQQASVADLKNLAPILRQLAKAGSDLPNSLQVLLTYPFPDSVLKAIKGDYLNGFVTTNFNTATDTTPSTPSLLPAASGGGG